MASIETWRSKFRSFVKGHKFHGLTDMGGNPIAFHNGKPMWDEKSVVFGDSPDVVVYVVVGKDEEHADRVGDWLRRFAAVMGRYHVYVDITDESDEKMSVEMSAVKDLSKRAKFNKSEVYGEFWAIGDPTINMYMESCDGSTTDDPICAERFNTMEDAVDAIVGDPEVQMWIGLTPFPSRVRPLKVHVSARVSEA